MYIATNTVIASIVYISQRFMLSSKSLNLSWSFAVDSQGVPVTYNQVWNKLNKGEVSLSPYATWEVQLVPRHSTVHDNVLASMAQPQEGTSVWLEVNGQGSYVTPGAISTSDMKKYYGSFITA